MRHFNTTDRCVSDQDYMVDIFDKVRRITAMVDQGCCFTINRARQFGKTTTLNQLERNLMGNDLRIPLILCSGQSQDKWPLPVRFQE